VVYAKRPFGGPGAVVAYLSRYTHRIAIANSRLVAFDGEPVTFKWKDYRAKADNRYNLMTLDVDEFISPLSDPRPARRFPPHSTLRPLRQWRARGKHRASAPETRALRANSLRTRTGN